MGSLVSDELTDIAEWNADDIIAVLDYIQSLELAEFTIETLGLCLHVKRDLENDMAQEGSDENCTSHFGPTSTALESSNEGFTITASHIGIFNEGMRPGDPPLAANGDRVEPDQPLGTITVMDTHHVVTAGRRSKIQHVLVADASPVQYGQKLFIMAAVDAEHDR